MKYQMLFLPESGIPNMLKSSYHLLMGPFVHSFFHLTHISARSPGCLRQMKSVFSQNLPCIKNMDNN